MPFDFTNLPPAPWVCDERTRCLALYVGPRVECFDNLGETLAYVGWSTLPAFDLKAVRAAWEFAALARHAHDVQQRRGLYAVPLVSSDGAILGWTPRLANGFDLPLQFSVVDSRLCFPTSMEAIVAADEWLTEQEAKVI